MNDLKLVFRYLNDAAVATNFVDDIDLQSTSETWAVARSQRTAKSATVERCWTQAEKLLDLMDACKPIDWPLNNN